MPIRREHRWLPRLCRGSDPTRRRLRGASEPRSLRRRRPPLDQGPSRPRGGETAVLKIDVVYLGRVTKSQILDAVREAKGSAAARTIEHLKKGDMAHEAERLLAGTGWLPALLRTRGVNDAPAESACEDPTGEEHTPSEAALDLPVLRAKGGGGTGEVYPVAGESRSTARAPRGRGPQGSGPSLETGSCRQDERQRKRT